MHAYSPVLCCCHGFSADGVVGKRVQEEALLTYLALVRRKVSGRPRITGLSALPVHGTVSSSGLTWGPFQVRSYTNSYHIVSIGYDQIIYENHQLLFE